MIHSDRRSTRGRSTGLWRRPCTGVSLATLLALFLCALGPIEPAAAAPASRPVVEPTPPVADVAPPPADLHADFSRLLGAYVVPAGVRYAAWRAHPADREALAAYVRRLEAQDPAAWPRKDALAYWINLYNATTLRLVLDNYPLKSIKDLDAPWSRPRVTVAGRSYALDAIENEVIRPTFREPRVHFALNCAAIGCPPLRPAAYTADSLDHQLNRSCRAAMHDTRFLKADGSKFRISKIFEWYRDDFVDAMGVREFISRYVPDHVARKLTDMSYRVSFLDYDWRLNAAP